MNTDWKLVGKIKEAHGLKGDFYALIFSGDVSWAQDLENFAIALDEKSEKKILSVKKLKPHKKGLIIKSDAIADRTEAEGIEGCLFFINQEHLVAEVGETIFLKEIEGFLVYDRNIIIGPIVEFSSNGAQDLLVVEYQDRKVEIPFVEAFIEEVKFREKRILMNLPEGLLE